MASAESVVETDAVPKEAVGDGAVSDAVRVAPRDREDVNSSVKVPADRVADMDSVSLWSRMERDSVRSSVKDAVMVCDGVGGGVIVRVRDSVCSSLIDSVVENGEPRASVPDRDVVGSFDADSETDN